jgi:hypothetical protein
MMTDDPKRPRRLGDLLRPPRSRPPLDLSAAIQRLEFGKDGRKVVYRTEKEQIENDDGTFSTFTTRWRDCFYLRETEPGRPPDYLVLSLPETMEPEEWTRKYQASSARDPPQRQNDADFMDDA